MRRMDDNTEIRWDNERLNKHVPGTSTDPSYDFYICSEFRVMNLWDYTHSGVLQKWNVWKWNWYSTTTAPQSILVQCAPNCLISIWNVDFMMCIIASTADKKPDSNFLTYLSQHLWDVFFKFRRLKMRLISLIVTIRNTSNHVHNFYSLCRKVAITVLHHLLDQGPLPDWSRHETIDP